MGERELIPAATVVLLRDGADGVETLMLRRSSTVAFGGMWVFPGGRVDPGELRSGEPRESARLAAVREAAEETGLELAPEQLRPWSYWIPPPRAVVRSSGRFRRYSTWFFVAPAPAGPVVVDGGEINEHRWLSPAEVLRLRDIGEIELVPPTFVTLWHLREHGTVASVMERAAVTEPREYRTRPIHGDPLILAWAGDAAHVDGGRDQPGPRHRLVMGSTAWHYELTAEP